MTHTPLTRSLNVMAAIALISGLGLAASGGSTHASLSGVGTSVVQSLDPGEPMMRSAPAVYTNDMIYAQADAAIQLVLGILLIVLGFFIHGLARTRGERPVHITVAPPKKRGPAWYWMEVQI